MRDKHLIRRARTMRKEPTKAEKALWNTLRAHRLNGWGFRRQVPVAGFVVDFACLELRLIVEVDGPAHDVAEQRAFDAERTIKLEQAGYDVVRVADRVVLNRIDHVASWLTEIGLSIQSGKAIGPRRLDTVPLP